MTLRKDVAKMDKDLKQAFKTIGGDAEALFAELRVTQERLNRLTKTVESMSRDQRRSTKVGQLSGRTYMTQNGKIKAIAEHLGLSFVVSPKTLTVAPAKVELVKVPTKVTKKGKK